MCAESLQARPYEPDRFSSDHVQGHVCRQHGPLRPPTLHLREEHLEHVLAFRH